MAALTIAPEDKSIALADLVRAPYPIYSRLRAETPIVRVPAVGRTFITKAADTRYVKDTPALFSSDEPNTPQIRAYHVKTLLRRDGEDHARIRNAMAPAFSAASIKDVWVPAYTKVAEEYVGRLPKGETVDLFQVLAGPIAARCLAHVLGITNASDEKLQLWSQALIDGSGNFSRNPAVFEATDRAHEEMNVCIAQATASHLANPNASALSAMVNAADPIEHEQILANIKVAIGGGINEPRDSLLTAVYGLLTNPDQMEAVRADDALWSTVFEESVRWVAPIQVSSRRVSEDTELRSCVLRKDELLLTIQASANRDEEIYENGHVFDIFRKKAPHQAFGSGPHYCLGMHIARRAVGQIILPRLFDRFPKMSLPDHSAVVFSGFAFRGPITLPVHLS